MVFNATFNNMSVISWLSVLLVGKLKHLKKTTDLSQVTDKLYHTSQLAGFELRTLEVMCTRLYS